MRMNRFSENDVRANGCVRALGFILFTLTLTALLPAARGQGMVNFNNRVTGTVFTRVYSPQVAFPSMQQTGNTATDTPAGTTVYTGTALRGSEWTAQLWAAPGADRPESELQPSLPTTTFRTTASTAGQVNAVTATLMGVPLDCPVATLQMRVWPSSFPTWEAVNVAWLTGTLGTNTFGKSLPFNLTNIGGSVNAPANLLGLQSFSLTFPSLEPPMLPPIVQHPQSQTVVVGQDATFSVTIGQDWVPDWYQWRFLGSNIAGATDSSLNLTNVQFDQAGEYSVVVTNYYGQSVSSNALLTVVSSTAPTITSQPQDQTVTIGQNASFSVTVSGGIPLAYQWWHDTATIPDATNASFVVSNAQPVNAGNYFVVVTNSLGSATSSNALLTVLPPTPPSITTQPQDQTVTMYGQPAAFYVTVSGTPPFAYQWWRSNTLIAGATSSTLRVNNVQPTNTGVYWVVVTNVAGSVTSSNAALTISGEKPTIQGHPTSVAANVGDTVQFAVAASGTVPLVYQWQFSGDSIPGASASSLVLAGVQVTNVGNYSVLVSNAFGSAASRTATLMLTGRPLISEHPQHAFANLGETVEFSVVANGLPPLLYQWRLNTVPIRGATGTKLVVPDIENVNFGLYSVVVSNAQGWAVSNPGQLFSSEGGGGTVVFNNRNVASTFSRVYGPELADPTIRKTGNTYTDTPAGNQLYTGSGLAGSNFIAQLWAARNADQPEAVLLPASPTTVFRTTPATAGQVVAVDAVLANVPKDYPIATLQLRAWDSREGTITDWSQVLADPSIPRGLSLLFNLENIGGDLNVPPSLIGLQSFNLFVATNHGAELSAGSSSSQAAEPGFSLTVNGDFGALYLIEVSTNAGGDWSYLATVTNLYGKVKFTDPLAVTNAPSRFYRALRIP